MNLSPWKAKTSRIMGQALKPFLPRKAADFLTSRAESLGDILPYEEALLDEGRTLFQLADGALGTLWELEPVAHEILAKEGLEEILAQIAKIFQAVHGPRVTLQFIFDAQPSPRFLLPSWFDKPDGFAETVQAHRIKTIQGLAHDPRDGLRLMRRRVFLSLRMEWAEGSQTVSKRRGLSPEAAFLKQADIVAETTQKIRDASKIVEDVIAGAKLKMRRATQDDLVAILRDSLHELEPRSDEGDYFKESGAVHPTGLLAKKLLNDHIQWMGDAVGVGGDIWEVLSWSGQANRVFVGMMTELLKATNPLRCVVNIRPTHNMHGIEALAHAVKNGGDAARERQRDEVGEAERRIAYGEKLLSVSLHILYRNVGMAIGHDRELRGGKNYGLAFSAATNIPLFVERYAALSVFLACLPLAYSRKVAGFIRRECRVLSDAVGPYLPVYAGTKGDPQTCQLMQNRAGEALWVNLRNSPTNPHLAVLGSSGGGKSFWLSNYLVGELAQDKNTMVFHIDCITSCEYTAKALGEDGGCAIYKPPQTFPNIFRGAMTAERLPTILGVLNVAVNLVSETKLAAAEKVLLADAIVKVYEDNRSYAKSKYIQGETESDLGHYEVVAGKTRLPRLTEIVDSFTTLCQRKGINEAIGQSLREKLLPFFGSGPYSLIFDQELYAADEARAPSYSLYDLEGVQGDRVVATLTSLIIIAEIERIADEPANKGRKGVLVIDELAVTLGGSSRELEEYVQAKWITLRKKGWVCIGLTNAANHYAEIPAPAAIWKVSANKLILPMIAADLAEAQKKGLITNPHHGALVASLQKKPGAYSEGLWIGEGRSGTFSYVPTGFDYWLAANQNADTTNIETVRGFTASYQAALMLLASTFPKGKVDLFGQPCLLTGDEIEDLKQQRQREQL